MLRFSRVILSHDDVIVATCNLHVRLILYDLQIIAIMGRLHPLNVKKTFKIKKLYSYRDNIQVGSFVLYPEKN